jgi:hypothetical protein
MSDVAGERCSRCLELECDHNFTRKWDKWMDKFEHGFCKMLKWAAIAALVLVAIVALWWCDDSRVFAGDDGLRYGLTVWAVVAWFYFDKKFNYISNQFNQLNNISERMYQIESNLRNISDRLDGIEMDLRNI